VHDAKVANDYRLTGMEKANARSGVVVLAIRPCYRPNERTP